MILLVRLVSVLLILMATSAFALNTSKLDVIIGAENISINSPKRFHEISDISPNDRELAEKTTSSTNKLLGVFVDEDDMARILKGEKAVFRNYAQLQTPIISQNKNYLLEDFQRESRALKDKIGKGLSRQKEEKLVAEINKNFKSEVRFDLGNRVSLGMFLDEPTVLGYAHLMKVSVSDDYGSLDNLVIVASALVFHKGKILFFYVFKSYENKGDIEDTRKTLKDWVENAFD